VRGDRGEDWIADDVRKGYEGGGAVIQAVMNEGGDRRGPARGGEGARTRGDAGHEDIGWRGMQERRNIWDERW
jgi:hypothetical protein